MQICVEKRLERKNDFKQLLTLIKAFYLQIVYSLFQEINKFHNSFLNTFDIICLVKSLLDLVPAF
jgi:hypothetical protein